MEDCKELRSLVSCKPISPLYFLSLCLAMSDAAGVKAASFLFESRYDQKVQAIRVLLDQSRAIHHEEHEQLQKAVWEAEEDARVLRVELTAARAELQSLKNLMSSIVQKLSQGPANDL